MEGTINISLLYLLSMGVDGEVVDQPVVSEKAILEEMSSFLEYIGSEKQRISSQGINRDQAYEFFKKVYSIRGKIEKMFGNIKTAPTGGGGTNISYELSDKDQRFGFSEWEKISELAGSLLRRTRALGDGEELSPIARFGEGTKIHRVGNRIISAGSSSSYDMLLDRTEGLVSKIFKTTAPERGVRTLRPWEWIGIDFMKNVRN